MSKQHYSFNLTPPRSTVPQDITDEDRRLMDEHSGYFQEYFAAGGILLFGPAMATSGAFGLAVLEVDNEGEARRFWQG